MSLGYPCCGSLITDYHRKDCPKFNLFNNAELRTIINVINDWGFEYSLTANSDEVEALKLKISNYLKERK